MSGCRNALRGGNWDELKRAARRIAPDCAGDSAAQILEKVLRGEIGWALPNLPGGGLSAANCAREDSKGEMQ